MDKEFGGNKQIEKVNIREKINLKHETVSLGDKKESAASSTDDGSDFKNEVIIKSGVISVKDEVTPIAAPKILGKIDLSGSGKKKHTPAVQAVEKKSEPAPAQEEQVQPAKKEEKKEVDVAPKEKTPTPQPAVASTATPVAEPKREIVIQSQTYDERMAADESNLFRPGDTTRLSGPKVLGKIDVKSFEKKKGDDGHRKREKRKRIAKDKIDITQKQNQPGIKENIRKSDNTAGAVQNGKNAVKEKRKKAPKPVARSKSAKKRYKSRSKILWHD